MRVLELERGGGLIAEALARARASDPPRTGVHVGTVVSDMLRFLDPKAYGREMGDATKHAMWEQGNIVEDLIAEQLVRRIPRWVKPAPRTLHGLTGSPDGWSARSKTIDEIKATWKGQTDFLSTLKWQGYVMQALTYGYMWGAVRLRISVMPMAFPQPPRTFIVRFSRREAQNQFDQVRQHAVDRRWLKAS